jgi:nucleotide-binding universal stress UspA family protein
MNARDALPGHDLRLIGITLIGADAMTCGGFFILTGIAARVAATVLILSLLITVGVLIDYWYARPRAYLQKKTQAVMQERRINEGDPQNYRVLIPAANSAFLAVLLPPAIKAARECDGHIILLDVVVVPDQLPFSAASRYVNDSRPSLTDAAEAVKAEGIPARISIRIAHRAAQAIIGTAIEENVDLLVMGWRGLSRSPFTNIGKEIDQFIDKVSCETLIIQQNNTPLFRNIFLPLADPDQTVSALQKAWFLAENTGSTIEILHVFPRAADAIRREKLISSFQERIARFRDNQGNRAPKIIFKTTDSSKPVSAIVKASGEFDCVVLSSTRNSWLKRKFSRGKMSQIARRIETPLILVR